MIGSLYTVLSTPWRLRSIKFLVVCFSCIALATFWLGRIDPSPPPNYTWKSPFASISRLVPWSSPMPISRPQPLNHLEHRRFLVRDWSIWLGWNNVRYIIETGLILAKLLDRELVIPAFTYANTCDLDDHVCDGMTARFTHGVAVELKYLKDRSMYPDPEPGTTILKPPVPSHQWKGWLLPTDVVLDIGHITASWNHSIRFQEFLKLVNYENPQSLGMNDGKWSPGYHGRLSYRKITPELFTNFSRTVVDHMPQPVKPLLDSNPDPSVPSSLIEKCKVTLAKMDATIPRRRMVKRDDDFSTWDINLLQGDQITGPLSTRDDPMLERCLASHGMRSLYGFTMAGWWMKAPYGPTKYVKRVENMVSWYDQLHGYDEQVLHIEGELHNGFPPASMLWTSPEARDVYTHMVRDVIRPPQIYHTVAAKLELKIRAKCGGRSWRASHMRRGDFAAYEWMPADIHKHWSRIKVHLDASVLLVTAEPRLLKAAHDAFGTSLEPPLVGDPVYLATNTRKKEEIEFLEKENIILLADLIEQSDRDELGRFHSSFQDCLAILEQCLMMRSAYYYGDAHSSVSGLILNRRDHFGIDERLTRIEYFKLPGDGQ